MTMIDEADRM